MTDVRAGGEKRRPTAPADGAVMRALWVWDPDRLRIASANRAAVELWGQTSLVELLERDFAPEEAYVRAMRAAAAALPDQGRRIEQALSFAPAGEPMRIRAEIRSVRLPDGRTGLEVAPRRGPNVREGEFERLRDMVQAAPTAIALFNDAGTPLTRNAADERLCGEDETPFEARYVDVAAGRRALGAALLDGAFSHVAQIQTRFGPRAHRVSLRRSMDPVSGSVAVIAYLQDVGERRIAEGSGASPFEAGLIEGMDAGVGLIDLRTGRLRRANPAARRMLRLGDRDAGAALAALFPDEAERIAAALSRLRSGAQRRERIDLYRPGGATMGQWLVADLRLFEAGSDSVGLLSLTDVSRERRALLYLKLEEAERTSALDGLGVATLSIDAEGRVLRAGAPALELLGLTAAENTLLADRLDPLTAKRLETYLRDGPIAAGRQLESGVEAAILPANAGEERRARIAVSGDAPREASRRTVAILTRPDAAPPAVAERVAEPFAEPLAEPLADVRGVLGSEPALTRVSHELRTPLNSILGFVDLLRSTDAPPSEEKSAEYLDDIAESARYMIQLVEELLTLRRAETAQMAMRVDRIDLEDLAARLIRGHAEKAQSRRITLRLDAEPGVPEVLADPTALRQAVSNLIANAVAYAGEGGAVSVTLAREDDGALTLEVSDDGPGLTKQELAEALTPFARPTAGAVGGPGGFGLGLPLAKALAENSGARFELDSAPGAGTSARITFPEDRLAAG